MSSSIESRIARLEAESQIRNLVASYSLDIDERNLDAVGRLFTDDASVLSADGVMGAKGRDAIIEQYRGRFRALGPGMHFMHDLAIEFEGDGTEQARGRVSGHAELWRNGKMMLVGLRYYDRYRNTADGWKFAERRITYFYYVPVDRYAGILGSRDRNLAYAEPAPADFPEGTAAWQAYADSTAD